MENNNLEELLILYALGELEPDEATAVEEELQKRPELAAQVEKVRRADGLLSDVFVLSDEAVQTLEKKTDKPKTLVKTEKPQGRLARRFAFTAAALALIVVAGALIYPQFVSKYIQIAMSPNVKTIKSSIVTNPSMNEMSSAAEKSVLEDAQEEAPQFALNAMGGADVAEEDVEEAVAEDIALEAGTADADMAEEDMAAPAPAAAPALGDSNIPEIKAFRNAPESPEPEEEAHAQYFMRNALYDVPSQKTADGMAPIKGEIPPMKEELLPEESLGEMAVDQMNKRLEIQRGANAGKKAAFKLNRQGVAAADAAPALDSYATLRKSVLEENKLPDPGSVKVEQWLSYFGVAEPIKAKEQERKSETTDDKDSQFVKAVNQFGEVLSCPEPADVKAFEEVLDLLKDSVGDDAKRLEFKTIVEKTIEIKKKSE